MYIAWYISPNLPSVFCRLLLGCWHTVLLWGRLLSGCKWHRHWHWDPWGGQDQDNQWINQSMYFMYFPCTGVMAVYRVSNTFLMHSINQPNATHLNYNITVNHPRPQEVPAPHLIPVSRRMRCCCWWLLCGPSQTSQNTRVSLESGTDRENRGAVGKCSLVYTSKHITVIIRLQQAITLQSCYDKTVRTRK